MALTYYLSDRSRQLDSVQFYCEGGGTWSIDVPVPAKRGSLIRSARFEDLESYVRAVFAGTAPADLPGLAFEAF